MNTLNKAGFGDLLIFNGTTGASAPPAIANTTISSTGTAVTVTTATAHGYGVGQVVLVAGVTGGAGTYNGAFTITAVTANTYTYNASGTGATGFGTSQLQIATPTTYNSATTAATIQADLNALASIGGVGGSVVVTQVNPSASVTPTQSVVYLIEFQGALGGLDVGQITVVGGDTVAAPLPAAATLVNGSAAGGVTVATGASLTLDGSLTIGNRVLTLNSGAAHGSGYVGDTEAFGKGHGSLLAVNGASTWGTGETPITLANSTVTVGTTLASDTLTLNAAIGGGVGLNKVGAGTLVLGGPAPNTYSGTTIVNDGTLALAKAPGVSAFTGGLTVGDNIGGGTDAVGLRSSEQLGYGVIAGPPALISPSILSTGQIRTTAAMSASATSEVQAIVFAGTAANNVYTILAGGPIAVPVVANVSDAAAQLQARLNAPGVLAPGVLSARVLQFGTAPNVTNVIIFNTAVNQLPMSVLNPTTGTTTVTTLLNGGLLGRQTVGGRTLQSGYNTATPTVGSAANVTLDAGSTLHLAGNLTLNALGGAPGAGAAVTGGRLALLADVATASAIRTITLPDLSAANDLVIGSAIIDGAAVPTFTGGLTKQNAGGAVASRLVLSGNNTYGGATLVSGGFLQAIGNAALGTANAAEGLGTNVANGAVLELNAVNLTGENLNLNTGSGANSLGLYDTPGLLTVAQPAGTGTLFGTGVLRVIGGASTITGNVDLRADGNTRFFGISVDAGSSLVIDGVLYASNSAGSTFNHNLVKLGDGLLELRGANSATVTGSAPNPVVTYTGTTSVNAGTLLLNKTTQAVVNTGTLTVGDGRGGDNADVLVYGPLAGNDTINNAATVNVMASGKIDVSQALAQGNEAYLIVFDPSTTGGNFTIRYAGTAVGPIAFSLTSATTAANITNALNPVLGFNNFTVGTLGDAFHYSILLTGALASANVRDLLAADVTLTGVFPTVTTRKLQDGAGNEVQTITPGGSSGGTVAPLFNGAGPVGFNTEVQLLSFPPTVPNGGLFTLTLNGVTTGNIAYNTASGTTAGSIKAALDAAYGVNLFTVTTLTAADNLNYVITAANGLANANLPPFTTVGVTATPAVGSMTTVRDGSGNETQTLTIGGTAGGTVTPSFNGFASTIPLTVNPGSPTAAQVVASLVTIPYLNGAVTVVGAPGGPFLIVFAGALSGADVPAIDVSNVAGGATASIATNADGLGNEVQSLTLGGGGGTFVPVFNGYVSPTQVTFTPGTAPTAATLQTSLTAIPALTGNVSVVGPAGGPFLIVFNNVLAGTNVGPLSANVTSGTATTTFATVVDGGAAVVPAALPYATGLVPSPTAVGLQAYLNAIPALANNVTVIGATGGPFSVVFRNGLGTANLSNSAFTFVTTGGTTASVVSDADGGNVTPGTINGEVQLLTFSGTLNPGNFVLNFNNYVTAAIPFDTNVVGGAANNAAAIQNALQAMPTIGAGNVSVTAVSLIDYLVKFQGVFAQRDVVQIGVTTQLPGATITVSTATPGVVIAGNLNFGSGGTRTINTIDGLETDALVIAANIADTTATALTTQGAGRIVLAGTNNYRGVTTVNGGELAITGATTLAAAITLNNTGTQLTLRDNGVITGTVPSLTLGTNTTLNLDNTGTKIPDRLPDATPITLNA